MRNRTHLSRPEYIFAKDVTNTEVYAKGYRVHLMRISLPSDMLGGSSRGKECIEIDRFSPEREGIRYPGPEHHRIPIAAH